RSADRSNHAVPSAVPVVPSAFEFLTRDRGGDHSARTVGLMARINTPVPSGRERRAPLGVVVEVEQINVELISAFLQDQGYDVLPALSGEQALELCMFRKPDLALF